jgi:8-oxo-dGTP pyrophosphatase MutT (NUDIX family)
VSANSASSTKLVRAAGGLVWRTGPDGVELALVHRPAYDDWSFPKGKLNDGESELDAALREVEEEIGVRCEIGREIGSISYTDGRGRPKTVRYWEMHLGDGDVLAPANEVDDARWVPVDTAAVMLTYDHDRRLLERFRGGA